MSGTVRARGARCYPTSGAGYAASQLVKGQALSFSKQQKSEAEFRLAFLFSLMLYRYWLTSCSRPFGSFTANTVRSYMLSGADSLR